MVVFIDTSSLLKHYVKEPGSERIDEYYISENTLIIAPITPIEVRAALKRKMDDKGISESTYQRALLLWEKDESLYTYVTFDNFLVAKSIGFISAYSLKTLDAIQSAAAVISKAEVIATSDKRMFAVLNKEFPEKTLLI